MNFLDEFQFMVHKYPDKAAIVDLNGERIMAYQELYALSCKIAAKLGETGDIPGRAVMVCMGRIMEYIVAEIGIMMCGAAFAPVLPDILFVYRGEMLSGLTFDREKYAAEPVLAGDVQASMLVMVMKRRQGYEVSLEYRKDIYRFEGRNVYRSGDLAKWNHHGRIEFMGRIDNQAKHLNLFQCGCFVAESQIEKQNLTSFMQKYLTPYMVPSVLVQLQELPLTNNGKLNKRAPPEPEYTVENKNYVKPHTRLQSRLCEIFGMALGVEQIGIEDDFFENGGTSLSASKVAMKCMSAGIQVSFTLIYLIIRRRLSWNAISVRYSTGMLGQVGVKEDRKNRAL